MCWHFGCHMRFVLHYLHKSWSHHIFTARGLDGTDWTYADSLHFNGIIITWSCGLRRSFLIHLLLLGIFDGQIAPCIQSEKVKIQLHVLSIHVLIWLWFIIKCHIFFLHQPEYILMCVQFLIMSLWTILFENFSPN